VLELPDDDALETPTFLANRITPILLAVSLISSGWCSGGISKSEANSFASSSSFPDKPSSPGRASTYTNL